MKQVTAILLGAGQRGASAYASYAKSFPHELRFVAVAEPRESRRQEFCKEHNIPQDKSFSTWEEALALPKFADCMLVCTQDTMHAAPVEKALRMGYHVLCEKPMSPKKSELHAMNNAAKDSGKLLSICYVLRYSPFFSKIKQLLNEGAVGQLVSIQHIEGVGYWHMAHSFVRGNWNKKEQTSPIILAKCCHDTDLLLWLADGHCTQVSSFGSLAHFTQANAPTGAPQYCLDGCEHRNTCPYYAPRFYLQHTKAVADGFVGVICEGGTHEDIIDALKQGPYGRCVYHCDNDVADNQVLNMQLDNNVTISMTMCAFTNYCERVINIMGSKGQIRGNVNENLIEYFDFATGNKTIFQINSPASGHGGSDEALMREFTAKVAADGATNDKTNSADAIESHIVALAAEESRVNKGQVISISQFENQ